MHDPDSIAGDSGPITDLLAAVAGGEPEAMDRLIAAVYAALRDLAAGMLRGENEAATVSPTALVHEAWFKLVRAPDQGWEGRAHFFGAAGRAMRQVLVDHARRRRAGRRDHRLEISLDDGAIVAASDAEILAVDEALERLAALDPRQAKVVELRYFIGLSIPETAAVLGASPATVKRDWALARAWLHRELSDPP